MIGLAMKNIWGRKTRSVLTIMGILVAMQLYIILSNIMNAYDKDMQKQISGMAGRIMVQQKSEGGVSFSPMDSAIKESDAKEVLGISGGIDEQRSSMVLFQPVVPSGIPNAPPAVLAVGLENGKEAAYFGNLEVDGKSKLGDENDAILGLGVAGYYKAKVGDSITVRDKKFEVVGILPQINSQLDSSFIIHLTTAQDLFTRPGVVNALMLTAKKTGDVEALAQKIQDAKPRLAASTSADMKKSADEMLSGQRTFFNMINNTIIAVAAFMIMIVMVMAVFERKKEIGTLKAIGASRRKILSMVIVESLSLSLIGGILALPVSVLFIRIVSQAWLFDAEQWVKTIIVAVVLGVLAGLWPAWSAQRVNPLESLRYE